MTSPLLDEDNARRGPSDDLAEAATRGLSAFMQASRANATTLVRGDFVVINPTTGDFVSAPTQAEAIARFVQAFPNSRGSLHRVGEEFDAK